MWQQHIKNITMSYGFTPLKIMEKYAILQEYKNIVSSSQ